MSTVGVIFMLHIDESVKKVRLLTSYNLTAWSQLRQFCLYNDFCAQEQFKSPAARAKPETAGTVKEKPALCEFCSKIRNFRTYLTSGSSHKAAGVWLIF